MVIASLIFTDFKFNKDQQNILYKVSSKKLLDRISRFKKDEDKYRSLIGECLLKVMLFKNFSSVTCYPDICRNKYGKPFFKNIDGIHFNISHSGNGIAAIISNKNVGIDIEKHENIDLSIAKRFFTNDEYKYIVEKDDESKKRFYKVWTLKESYIKAIGIGMSCPLDSFSVINAGDALLNTYDNKLDWMQINSVRVNKDYSAAICIDRTLQITHPIEIVNEDTFFKEAEKYVESAC